MSSLFDSAFARLDHADVKQAEFATAWSSYVDSHPWESVLTEVADQTFEITLRVCAAAPPSMSLAFSDWLATLRASLDNGLYAWAAAISGQNPPPSAEKLQFPIATNEAQFKKQAKRLDTLPLDIVAKLEKAQPYHSPYGYESNLLFWLHELARTDRHRTLHIGLGRVAEHRVQVALPVGTRAEFDTTIQPYNFIDGELVVARFTTSRRLRTSQISFNPNIAIDPEIKEWSSFRLNKSRQPLKTRMTMTQIFIRNHLENMALFSGEIPPGGFKTFPNHLNASERQD